MNNYALLGKEVKKKGGGEGEKKDLSTEFCQCLYRIVTKFKNKYNELLSEQ